MMQCISKVTYSIRINGKPSVQIVPTRGLRQGDPLSPYLFLLCAEGLSTLNKNDVVMGNMEGISICWGGPSISLLFFPYDSFIFCKATTEKCEALQQALQVYAWLVG